MQRTVGNGGGGGNKLVPALCSDKMRTDRLKRTARDRPRFVEYEIIRFGKTLDKRRLFYQYAAF